MPPKQPYDFVIPFHYLLKIIKLLMHGLQCSLVLEDLKKGLTIESSKESTSLEMMSYGFVFMISRVVRLVLKAAQCTEMVKRFYLLFQHGCNSCPLLNHCCSSIWSKSNTFIQVQPCFFSYCCKDNVTFYSFVNINEKFINFWMEFDPII